MRGSSEHLIKYRLRIVCFMSVVVWKKSHFCCYSCYVAQEVSPESRTSKRISVLGSSSKGLHVLKCSKFSVFKKKKKNKCKYLMSCIKLLLHYIIKLYMWKKSHLTETFLAAVAQSVGGRTEKSKFKPQCS